MAISPSAIEKFNLCQRRYFFNYIMKEWEPQTQTKAAAAGSAVHRYLEDGVIQPVEGYDVVKLAEEMRKSIPYDDGVVCEHKFKATIEGVEFSGIVDRLSDDYIVDFKTTGSDAKYAKTGRKLLNDEQRLIYSAAFPDRPRSRWITGLWRDYSVVVGERENVPEDRERFKLHVLQPATEMLALHPGQDPLSFPLPGKADKYTGLTSACKAFGKPCPYTEKCFPKKRRTLSLKVSSPLLTDTASKEVLSTGEAALNELTRMAQEDGMYTSVDKAESKLPLTLPVREPVSSSDLKEEPVTPKYLIENLYIDCFPISKFDGELEYSHQYIFEAGQEVASDMGVASAMLVDFGKGPHLVAAQLIATLMDRPEPIKHLFLETRSAEGRACMQELTARSKFVVKGAY